MTTILLDDLPIGARFKLRAGKVCWEKKEVAPLGTVMYSYCENPDHSVGQKSRLINNATLVVLVNE